MYLSSLKILLLFMVAFLVLEPDAIDSRERSESAAGATIKGKVTIQTGSRQTRVFRGRAYRGGRNSQSNDGNESTPYQNTIISAHPLSFDANTQPLDEPVKIRQENATFFPNITPVTVGSTVQFINDDPFYHNVFSLTPGAKFNIGRRPTGDVYSKRLPRMLGEVQVAGLGEIELFCDIHSQMNAQILSLDTPYFVRVNEDGTYALNELPAGRYEIRAYNPNFETSSAEVSVSDNENLMHNFNLSN